MKIILGARGSKLSLAQTQIVKNKLLAVNSQLEIEVTIITTKGDKNLAPIPLDTVGKGWFTKELDKELLRGTIDIAVHSLKDLPESLPKGLCIAGIPEREDPSDVLVSTNNVLLKNVKPGAVIGTDSIRRKVQILHKRPDVIVKSLRGNVDSRLKKLETGEYDAIMLAAAGLKRLDLDSKITERFAETDIIPSPGQGALAIVVKEDNETIRELLTKLNDKDTIIGTTAERAFSKQLDGGCKTPTGAYAKIDKNTVTIYGMIGTMDGKHIIKESIEGPTSQAKQLGIMLAKNMFEKSKQYLLEKKYIVITRPEPENTILEKKLQQYGASIYNFPTIQITENNIDKQILTEIHSFDWIVFTSSKGVEAFMHNADQSLITILKNKKIAVVGPKTAEKLTSYNLKANFMPTKYTTHDLAKELTEIAGKQLLLARSNIASKELVTDLKKKKAIVTDIPMYTTESITTPDKAFEKMIKNDTVNCLTFTSPSTVIGFFDRIGNAEIKQKVLAIPVISVGPVTTKTAKEYGFTHIYTADEYTTDGMIKKLLEIA